MELDFFYCQWRELKIWEILVACGLIVKFEAKLNNQRI